ncbi:hypothetical protein [Mycoplasma procyoni]|uniref:hypothetical protein n=1 Tax=Mycoplasma procyoni TaxID=568784 RepID=UPI00197CA225|nr:hypothetical protein [Mycoplasma procyoni]MBN3534922.1 hypothetical protein [Mycoplasma procyoni]
MSEYKEYENHDFAIIRAFEESKIRPSHLLRSFYGDYLFYDEFINFYWVKFINRKIALRSHFIIMFWLLFCNIVGALATILTVLPIMLRYESVLSNIGLVGLVMSCLAIPIALVLIQPLLILMSKKMIIKSYYNNFYRSSTKAVAKQNYDLTKITNFKKWIIDIFRIRGLEKSQNGCKASDNLRLNENIERITYNLPRRNDIEKEKFEAEMYDYTIFLYPIGWLLSFLLKPLFLSNKLLFVKRVFEKNNIKINVLKYLVINWIIFIVLFVAPITTITSLISVGTINSLLWSILSYVIILIAYWILVSFPKYYLIRNAIIKEL